MGGWSQVLTISKRMGSPERPEELVDHQALMQGTEAWQFMDGDKIVAVRPQGRLKADNGTALVAAATAGLGIAWLPDGLTRDYLASGALVPVMTRYPPPPAGAYVVRPPGQHPSRKVRVLTELLIEYCEPVPDPAGVGRQSTNGAKPDARIATAEADGPKIDP